MITFAEYMRKLKSTAIKQHGWLTEEQADEFNQELAGIVVNSMKKFHDKEKLNKDMEES